MSLLSSLFRRRPGRDVEAGDGGTSALGLAGWDGADRWPRDDAPAPDLVDQDVDLWINMDPGRPSAGPL